MHPYELHQDADDYRHHKQHAHRRIAHLPAAVDIVPYQVSAQVCTSAFSS
jgi:hypothetical protein